MAAVYSVVNATLSDEPSSTSTASTATTPKSSTGSDGTKSSKKRTKRRRAYVVKSGDTLSAISIKTGVSMLTIKRLNPKIQADTLHAGQRVRLSR